MSNWGRGRAAPVLPRPGPVAQPGQSGRLIIGWSLVRSQPGPPLLYSIPTRTWSPELTWLYVSIVSEIALRPDAMMASMPCEMARYDLISDFYLDVVGTEVDGEPTAVALLDLLGAVRGMRVLDLACGHGRIARELARCGARVVGVDISDVLLDVARAAEIEEPLGITYLKVDVTSGQALAGETFDGVGCNHGLADIDVLDGAVAPLLASSGLADGSSSPSFTPASPGGTRTRPAAGRRMAAITRRDGGSPRIRAFAARWAPITGRCRPTSTPLFATT